MVADRNLRTTHSLSLLLLCALLLAMGLRFYRLDAQSLWNDEGSSVALAQRDLVTITADAGRDIHPPLYYWLLHIWVRLVGTTEFAVRSLSALLGVVLVPLAYILGRRLMGAVTGLLGAFFVGLSPFQIYYAQEARMYMLLALLTALCVQAMLWYLERGELAVLGALVVAEALGLYTHYSFVFVVAILNLGAIVWWVRARNRNRWLKDLTIWAAGQIGVVLLYAPWLPVAFRQISAWPSPETGTPWTAALVEAWRWLALGPAANDRASGLFLVGLAVLMLLGWGFLVHAAGRRQGASLLALWIGLPVLFMLALGLYREAYLKFLLVAELPVALLWAFGLTGFVQISALDDVLRRLMRGQQSAQTCSKIDSVPGCRPRWVYQFRWLLLGLGLVVYPSVQDLARIYHDPAYARDDYRAIAAYVQALGEPGDGIVLNAPGQQEVFGYYYDGGLPVHPLPEQRPLDVDATERALQAIAHPGSRLYAVFWATDESDPDRYVEGWLDAHAYKALDLWYGNVRLVVYAMPDRAPSAPDENLDVILQAETTGDLIVLEGYSLLDRDLAGGDIAQITLFWRADQSLGRRYKVFVHVLDDANNIVGQRDAEPGGGALLTTLWEPGQTVVDNYGVTIHPATPPGEYRVEVGMYDAETGLRLVTPEGSGQVWLEPLHLDRPAIPPSLTMFLVQEANGQHFGDLVLLGYDAYKLGFAHQPDTSLVPGDVLHTVLYWQALSAPKGDWQAEVALVDEDGRAWAYAEAGLVVGYPTSQWQAGDVWRGLINLGIATDAPPGRYRLRVQPVAPDGARPEPFLSKEILLRRSQ